MIKLLKYEFEITSHRYFMLFLIYILICSLLSSMMSISLRHVESFAGIVTYGMLFMLIYTVFKNYKQVMFTTHRYITQTLPYSHNQLLLSQMILSFFFTGLGLIIVFFGIQMMCTVASSQYDIGLLIFHIPSTIQTGSQLLKVVFMLGLSLMIIILAIYCICTFVHSCYIKKNHLFFSVMITALASFLLLTLFTDSGLGILSTLSQYYIISFVIYGAIFCILYLFLYFLLSKKIE